MQNIYNKFDVEFLKISAYYIGFENKPYGRIIFKNSASNGTTKCYLHIWGYQMQLGKASGYGYNKASASLQNACEKMLQHFDFLINEQINLLKDVNNFACDYAVSDSQKTMVINKEIEKLEAAKKQFLNKKQIAGLQAESWQAVFKAQGFLVQHII